MTKKALILGINGQDGSFLADILLEKGYEVHGLVRRSSHPNLWRIQHCLDKLTLHQGDVTDSLCLHDVINKVLPDEIYNEADQDHVGFSFAAPRLSVDVTYGAVASLLEIIKGSKIKLFQPLSATMFGDAPAPQNEETPFNPQSPYACAKTAAYYLCKHYREKHGVFVSTAILYNHDSERRQGSYLLHEICRGVVRIAKGDQKYIVIGNLGTRVDIGYAPDVMWAAFNQMQLPNPTHTLIGTGVSTSIGSMLDFAFKQIDITDWKKFVGININFNTVQPELRSLHETLPRSLSIYGIIHRLIQHYTDTL